MHTDPENGYDPVTGEWNDSLKGDYLWSSVNTREATPDVTTPYTWSALRYGFAQMTILPGHLPVGNICGRVYNNASAGATAFRALGQGNSFDASSKELYGLDPNDIEAWQVPLIPFGFFDRLQVIRNVIRIGFMVRNALKSAAAFVDANPAWCATQLAELPDYGGEELVRWWREVTDAYVVRCFWWMAGSAITQANHISKLRRDLLKIVSPADAVALLSNVCSEDEFLASLGVVAGLDRLRRGKLSREAYLQMYGHRGPHEVEMYYPRPIENPQWIDEQLEGLESSIADVDTLLQEQRARSDAARKKLQKASPKRHAEFIERLQEAARLTRLREAVRSEVVRTFLVLRAYVLRAGSLCGVNEEAFFLEHDELSNLLRKQADVRSQIPMRKAAYQKYSALPQYPTIIMGRFDPIEWAADPDRRTDIYDVTGQITYRLSNQIKGLPVSVGKAQGSVRILFSPEDGDQLQPGEILVALTTNVGWTPLFPRAAAIVTDVGAPLSHAAIVARELGIPAVVGCFNATTVLKNGDRVRVDGGSGLVEVIERKDGR